jgi:hypothetical protein
MPKQQHTNRGSIDGHIGLGRDSSEVGNISKDMLVLDRAESTTPDQERTLDDPLNKNARQ